MGPGEPGRPALGEWEELTEAKGPLGVPIPSYGGASLPNISASILAAMAQGPTSEPAFSAPLYPRLDPFHGAPAEGPVILFLIDGLGWFDFLRWAGDRPGGRGESWQRSAHPITTVFPSTTTAALCSLSTSAPPGATASSGTASTSPNSG